MKIVAFLGFKGCGKDTAATALIEHGYKKYAFADSLKDVMAATFNWPRDLMEGTTAESRIWRETPDKWWAEKLGIPGFSPRIAMTYVGTEILRSKFNDGIWIYNFENRVMKGGDDKIVITDCRFPIEVDLIRRYGGKLIRVDRGERPVFWETSSVPISDPDFPECQQKMVDDYPNIHISEWAWNWIQPDSIIINSNGVEELQFNTQYVVKNWGWL